MKDIRVKIESFQKGDCAAVLGIENDSFDHPWTRKDFLGVLTERNCNGMVAACKRKGKRVVVGYMIYELHRDRIDLWSIAVANDYRRRAVGTQLIGKLRSKLSPGRRHSLTLQVREANLSGQLFFRGHLFRAEYILPKHYSNGEGAIGMRYRVRGAVLTTSEE